MRILEIISNNDIAPFLDGFVIRRSRSRTSFLAGDRNRYSVDLNPLMGKLLRLGISNKTKIWLGDPKQKEGQLIGTVQSILDRQFPPRFLQLYHGTSSDRLPEILKRGLIPVRKTDRVWNAGQDITQEDAVYLTAVKAQAEYYAMKAVEKNKSTKPVILEIIIKRTQYDHLIADDDYMAEKHQQNNWKTSLSYYGQVAFRGSIPTNQIRVIATGVGAVQHSQ